MSDTKKEFELSKENLLKALHKKAVGYSVNEEVEEYNYVDENLVLTKKKCSKKYYPPDLNAIQYLLDNFDNIDEYKKMTSEELEKEKCRLLKMLEATIKNKGGKDY